MKWVVSLLQEMATVWVGITPPALTDSSGQATGTVAWLASNLMPLTVVLAMVSIFVGSIKIAIEERPAAHLRQLVKYLFTFVLVSGSAAAFVGMSIAASDDLATWMIHNAIGQETFAHKIGTLLGVTLQGAPPVGFAATAAVAFATIVLGILACLAMIGAGDDHAVARRDADRAGGDAAGGRGGVEYRGRDDVVQEADRVGDRLGGVPVGGGGHLLRCVSAAGAGWS